MTAEGGVDRHRRRPSWRARRWPFCCAPGLSSSPSPSSNAFTHPLMQSLADADGLTAYCRGQVDAELKEERKRVAAAATKT